MRWEFHPEALAEYEEAAQFYAEREPGLERGFVRAIEGCYPEYCRDSGPLAAPRGGCSALSHACLSLWHSLHH